MNAPGGARPSVLAVLDDAAAGEGLLRLSTALARTLQRGLTVVYVESAQSLVAAALPITQVLAQPGLAWQPLRPQDVEQGFRAHAARLRELASRLAVPDAVSWSLRVVRGNLQSAAAELSLESDLLFVAAAPPLKPPVPARARPQPPRRVVAVALEPGEAGQRAQTVARQLAQALAGEVKTVVLETTSWPAEAAGPGHEGLGRDARNPPPAPTRPDVLVLASAPLTPAARSALLRLRCPVLLVG
jgi:hypothetical protein